MSDQPAPSRLLSLYATYAFTDAYWTLAESDRKAIRESIASRATQAAKATHFYLTYPARNDCDFLIWCSWHSDDPGCAAGAFKAYGQADAEWRRWVKPVHTFWGFSRPSSYSRGKSEQDMDPMEGKRGTYLAVYPFSKTKDWYVKSMDARQGMMNEHIKLGKQYFDIKQLLLYSFGLQDQEFVVSYEMEDLTRFSELVNALRATEARLYTLLDTPLITGIYLEQAEFIEGATAKVGAE